jgi:lipopolysaccharide/colanic/teichoic acid biosynthesis glycosyltransferase
MVNGVGPGPARRSLDIVVAVTGLMVALPLLAVTAVLIKLTSRGPVIFRQERVGQGWLGFTLYKLRTMRAGAGGPTVTAPGDRRVTAVGHFLRASSLDEVPQLVNVLRGDMTLVGPRPETLALAARYPAGCQVVFAHRPGLTGPSQLRYRDSDVLPPEVSDTERYYLEVLVLQTVGLDLQYLADPSLRRTIGVLFGTAAHVLKLNRRPGRAGEAAAA